MQKFGGKIVLLASTFLSTIVMALTPLAVFYGEHIPRWINSKLFLSFSPNSTGDAAGLIIARVLYGFLQGPLVPSVAYFAIAWFPIEERGRVSSVSFIGINVSEATIYLNHLLILHVNLPGIWFSLDLHRWSSNALHWSMGCCVLWFSCSHNNMRHSFCMSTLRFEQLIQLH